MSFSLYNITLFVAVFMMGWAFYRGGRVLLLYRDIKKFFDGDRAVFWGKGAALGMTIVFAVFAIIHCAEYSVLNIIVSASYICLIQMDKYLSRVIRDRIRDGMFSSDKLGKSE